MQKAYKIIRLYSLLFWESFSFAVQSLRANWLRTTLSLFGVTIGVFAIITVFTVVDSLERSIKESLNFLGKDVLYIQKWPWAFGPDYPWWKYVNRPVNTYEEYEFLARYAKQASAVALFTGRGGAVLQSGSLSIEDVTLRGVSYSYSEVANVDLAEGRYFLPHEMANGLNVAIIGYEIAQTLFPNRSAVGKDIRLKGRKLRVIGVMKREGANFLGAPSSDKTCIMPFFFFAKIYKVGKDGREPVIALKGKEEDAGLVRLEAEARGLMRRKRALRPTEEDNFAINRPEFLTNQLNAIFGVLNVAGGVIGSFAMLVGAFGIANIMFVSVKERTPIIGVQKSLGAKNFFILNQFLFEAIFLSIFGGLIGLFLVWLVSFVPLGSLELRLTAGNILRGVLISAVVGVVSGIIPAWTAARLDPVKAIRAGG
ncbi:ABC transporter permease [Thermonema rossianum]|uniref:ABC transporter permease n=1 Tax=Thermonema rossianum TaxID=55505 RepID=UPI0006893D18|nr:ABC transporter permease [Thermonema rossianum]